MPLVSDTTALRYLIEIEAVHLLPVLFGQVTIPPEVAAELQRPKTPVLVRAWMAAPPSWLIIRQPTLPPEPRLRRLHAGERDALLLIYEAAAPLFLTDDGSAYKVALAQNIPVIRTLRVLEMAAEHGDCPTTRYLPSRLWWYALAGSGTKRWQQDRLAVCGVFYCDHPQPAYQGSLFLHGNCVPGMRYTASSSKGSGREGHRARRLVKLCRTSTTAGTGAV